MWQAILSTHPQTPATNPTEAAIDLSDAALAGVIGSGPAKKKRTRSRRKKKTTTETPASS